MSYIFSKQAEMNIHTLSTPASCYYEQHVLLLLLFVCVAKLVLEQ